MRGLVRCRKGPQELQHGARDMGLYHGQAWGRFCGTSEHEGIAVRACRVGKRLFADLLRLLCLLSFRGKGKMRNRRYTLRKGPLVVYGADHGISKAFR